MYVLGGAFAWRSQRQGLPDHVVLERSKSAAPRSAPGTVSPTPVPGVNHRG